MNKISMDIEKWGSSSAKVASVAAGFVLYPLCGIALGWKEWWKTEVKGEKWIQ